MVALELVLAQTKKVAVYVSRLLAYPTGFEFDLMTIAAPGQDELGLEPLLFGPHRHHALRRGSQQEGLPAELLRIGVQYADGAKATNTAGYHHDQEKPPPGPVMHPGGGGGGGGGDWHQTQWVWPLPPPGAMSFVCEWPAAGIALTRSQINAQIILNAASRAQTLFPDQQPAHSSPSTDWTSSTIQSTASKPQPQSDSE